jgi:hypothetical protein
MRKLTTILAAAAAPAALAAILLGTAGSAAASTTATTAAAVTGGHAVTWERGVDDTFSPPGTWTGPTDPGGNGPIWAYDTVQRQVTWTPDTATPGAWDVTVATFGTYHAFANPITGAPWKGAGLMAGEIQYVVTATAPAAPSAANLPAVSPNTLRSQGIVDELFGQPNGSTAVTMTGGAYNFVYEGIPGAPGGLYFQH